MNYSDFTEAIAKKAEETVGKGGSVFVNRVIKNNDTKLDGLVIMEKNRSVAPTIYLNDYYTKYKKGMSIDRIMEEILTGYSKKRDFFDKEDIASINNYEKMKFKIAYKLINFKMNEELLKRVPHKRFLDLAIVYYIVFSDKDGRLATALLHNSHLDVWDVNAETIHKQAEHNTPRMFRAKIRPIEDVLNDALNAKVSRDPFPVKIVEDDDDFSDIIQITESHMSMYVLTNESGINGAACMLYKKTLAGFGKIIKQDFFVLPSSVHELILVPRKDDLKKDCLLEMVREINKTEVSPDEVLSDRVYEYDYATDMIGL